MHNLPLRPLSIFTLICFFFSSTIAPVFAQVAYSYDQNGNMTTDGTNCYTYNDANQLSQVKNCATNQIVAQYGYDYQGNRIEKKVYSNGSLQKTVYSPNKTYETVKSASAGAAVTGTWTTGSGSSWAAVIVSFNSGGTTPTLVQKNYGWNGGVGSVATAFSSSVTSGHTIIAITDTSSGSNLVTSSVTDNQGNTYTQLGTTQHTSGGNNYIQLWYTKNVTGGLITVTAHQSGSDSGTDLEILEYSGLSTTSPADQAASTIGTNTSPSGGSITPTSNNALVISAFADDNNDNVTMTGTSGWTVEKTELLNSTYNRMGIEDTVQTTGAATSNTSYYFVNDQLAARKNPDGSKNYYLNDNLGSINKLTNQSGAVIEASSYYPYGQIRSGGTQSKYLYTGQENDAETGLDYYNSRYYSPQLQRFIQPDSVLPNVYDPQQLNRYAYARNNPLRYTDPSGHNIVIASIIAILLAAIIFMPAILPHNTHTTPAITHAVATGVNNTTQNIQKAASQTKAVATSVAKTVQTAVSSIQQSSNKQQVKNNPGNSGQNQSEANFRSQPRLEEHFGDHGIDLGYDNQEDYLNGARKLIKGGDGVDALVRPNSDELYFRQSTGEFGIVDKTGVIRTYFRPDNPVEYWNNEMIKWIR